VIARDSSFVFKSKQIEVKQVGRELGVRYLLEGSVRKAGERIRISSQLIDTTLGTHIWADHFDGTLSNIFDLQDRITASVVGAIEPKLRHAEIERARRKPTESGDAYDLFLRAVALNATRRKEDNKEALRLLNRAIEIDPRYAAAYALASYCYLRQKVQGFVSPSDPGLAEGVRMARLAAEIGKDDPEALWMAAVTLSFVGGELEDGLALLDRSLALNPNSANGLMASGLVRAHYGDTEAAIAHLKRSRQLSPLDPISYGTCLGFAVAHFMAGRCEEALAWSDRALQEVPTYYPPALHIRIACCGLLGRLDDGRKWLQRLLVINPDASLASVRSFYRDITGIRNADRLEAMLDGLRRVGLPEDRAAGAAMASLPTKPTIAVLPFVNVGGDLEQQYFSDGITEDIITELSRYRSLRVIARNSSFQFRGPSVDLVAVRRKLGVQFVVEGSVRKIGSRLRLAVQLVDAATESHVWAERYDREVKDIFAVQDHMTGAIAATLEGRVAASGAEQARRRPTKDWAAYDYFLQGRERQHRYDFIAAEPLFARAIELDPGYAQAYARRAHALLGKYWTDLNAEAKQEALASATKSLSLDEADAWCQMTMGLVLTHHGQRDVAGPYFDRALALNPGDVQIVYVHAWWLVRVGRADEGLEELDRAMQLDPFPPNWCWEFRAIALLVLRRYEDVIRALARMSHYHAWDHAYKAACYAYLNRPEEARAAASEALRLDPHFSVTRFAQIEGYTLPAQLKNLLDGMRKAGLPE
jgi:TolB-like protein